MRNKKLKIFVIQKVWYWFFLSYQSRVYLVKEKLLSLSYCVLIEDNECHYLVSFPFILTRFQHFDYPYLYVLNVLIYPRDSKYFELKIDARIIGLP